MIGARESRSKFYKKNPQKYREYYDRTKAKNGADGHLFRFYRRYPDAPKCCQACGEARVVEIAHRPEFKRNGAWRSKENTSIEKVWILCPTCHRLLDYKGYTPQQLGITEYVPSSPSET